MSNTKKSRPPGRTVEPNLNGAASRLVTVPLSQLHLLSCAVLPENAGVSVPTVVMLQPLIVVQTNDQAHVLVDGYRRYGQHRKNGVREAPATIIEAQLTEQELVTFRIALNRNRTMDLREKLKLLEWAQNEFGKEAVQTLSKLMGVSRKEIASVSDLLGARDYVVDAVARDKIHSAALPAFLLLSQEDQDVFLATFSECALSVQTQREFLEWITEIAYRDGVSMQELFNEESLQAVFANQKLNWPQRIQKLRETLFQRRFPLLDKARDEWNDLVKRIRPGEGKVAFVPSPNFEKNELDVKITVTRGEQMKSILDKLSNVDLKDWEKLVYPVQDEKL